MVVSVGDTSRIVVAWGAATPGEDLATGLRDRIDDATVVLATGAETVRSRVSTGTVDCVVLDHDPPSIHGIDLLQRVRTCDPDIPVILSPAPAADPAAAEVVDADVSAYVPRNGPIPPIASLSNRVETMVASRQRRRDRATAANRFGALVENMADAVVVVDAGSTIQYANPALERVLGYAPCDVRGESLTTLVPERHEERHLAAVRAYLQSGERALDWENVEFPAVHATGHEVPVEVAFGEFEQGGKRFFVGSIRDRSG